MNRSLAFATDVALRAAEGAEVERTTAGVVVRMGSNPGFRWGNFLLVDRAGSPGARTAEHAAAFPGAGFTTIGVDAPHAALDEGAWLSAGFTIERLAVLTSRGAISAPAAGVRPLVSDEDWAAEQRIALALEDAPDEDHLAFVRRRTAERRRAVEAGRIVWLGVEVAGAVVATAGIADAGDRIARFQDVQTDAAHRRRGHASALIAAGVRIAADAFGSALFVLVAERAGPAIGLYRRLGFGEVETQLQLSRVDPPSASLGAVGGAA
ncbi:GNAT family N-acetyltransferase [Amnibacterium kyonggiense]|uniref:Acetyltransferase (GNAT) family protein n=1 Tax=Amnibacterium kyonggiense TaxID=595671 RepID=A0A4R7FF54_9MICO|nr:GNAT family N-acetyltransferase [Amnibacterium kyonggiense]TDS76003.1 acetyltransferase (GNAT) family protein [Amnibacterium kyonggiense]